MLRAPDLPLGRGAVWWVAFLAGKPFLLWKRRLPVAGSGAEKTSPSPCHVVESRLSRQSQLALERRCWHEPTLAQLERFDLSRLDAPVGRRAAESQQATVSFTVSTGGRSLRLCPGMGSTSFENLVIQAVDEAGGVKGWDGC